MKKTFAHLFLLTALLASVPSLAQMDSGNMMLDPVTGEVMKPISTDGIVPLTTPAVTEGLPAKTAASRVAVLFHRLTGQLPPFGEWAKETPEYKAANEFDRSTVLEVQTSMMQDLYRLAATSEPIVVDMAARLGDYSFNNKGFLITNFTEDVFFPFTFNGRNYAVTIPGLQDNQWLPIEDEKLAMRLDTAAAKNDRMLHAVMQVEPSFADKTGTVMIDGAEYWILGGRLTHLQLYVPEKKELLYELDFRPADHKPEDDAMLNELNQLKNN